MNETFGRKEKLKSKKEIELLFKEGSSIRQFPIRLVYRRTTFQEAVPFKASVSVSKRNFKKATDRNKIKRLLREAYRKNNYLIASESTAQYSLLLIYAHTKMPEYDFVFSKMKKLLLKFAEQELGIKTE